MLSRSSSTAGDGLQRAKSTSSHQTASSGQTRISTSADPFVAKQHAEVAALEAYSRARQYEDGSHKRRPAPQRRRSQNTGRTEGSHFEDARLGRRRLTSTRPENRQPLAHRSRPPTISEPATDSADDEMIISRKRSVIPPSSSASQPTREYLGVPTTSSQRVRKTQSTYTDGSPVPRRPATLNTRSSTLQLSSTPIEAYSDGYGGNLAHLTDFDEPTDTLSTLKSAKIRETQTDEEILALARDKCLQGLQQKKLRERKSFISVPFQRRRTTAFFKGSDDSYDTKCPPFNYADGPVHAPLPPAPDPLDGIPVTYKKSEKKLRNATDSLKGRIKNVFRKASRAPSGWPAQHIEAKHLHYTFQDDAIIEPVQHALDPFVAESTPVAALEEKTASGNSRLTVSQASEIRSRVTSWTSSTVAGTCTSRAAAERLAPVEEHGGLRRTSSAATLRKAKSFFGRPVQNKLRRSSKAELNTSEESQGLYSALQHRMRPSRRTPTPDAGPAESGFRSQRSRVPSALSTLPSHQRPSLQVLDEGGHSTPTLRSVSPDPAAYRLAVCSPVPEVLSPDAGTSGEASNERYRQAEHSQPLTLLQRRQATKAPAPSQEQLQRRMEKSRNRWQGPLDALSPRPSKAEMEENPYELRSLSAALQRPQLSNDLPHHAKVTQLEPVKRAGMLSPSLYSRATDGASPRPLTPADQGGMMVTITGRELRSYSISPAKAEPSQQQQPAQTSGQWRRWLSDEMHGFKAAQEDFSLAQVFLDSKTDTQSRSTSLQQESQANALRTISLSPPVDARPCSAATATSSRPHSASTGRPRANSKQSSYMNERFPMVNISRNSSDRSIASRRVYSRAGSSSEQDVTVRPSIDSQAHRRAAARQRVVTGRVSIAQMQSVAPRQTDPASAFDDTTRDLTMSGALPSDTDATIRLDNDTLHSKQQAIKANKHKSAFELRANYKSTATGRSTPLEIRRKAINENTNLLEDNTIRNISAGPYAASPPLAAPSASFSRGENNENTPPLGPQADGLPALSSSEWLAAGPNKSRKPSAVHPAYRNRSMSKYSPPKGTTVQYAGKVEGGKGSPAQRMASEWLEKRSRESTPAFM